MSRLSPTSGALGLLRSATLCLALGVAIATTGCTSDTTVSGSSEQIESDFPREQDIVFSNGPDTTIHSVCLGAPDGSACDNGDLCTTHDICIGGECITGGPVSCTEEGPCRQGTCEPALGCIYEDVDDARPCQVNCFGAAACYGGVCLEDENTEIVCPASDNECIERFTCDKATGQCDVAEYESADTVCNSDDNVCSVEMCDGKGTCQTTEQMDDCKSKQLANPCWTYSCTPKTGCVPTHFVEGLSCEDGNSCTLNDQCSISSVGQKTCVGIPVALDDANPCTNDACADGVVTHTPVDGVPCAPNDGCSETGMCNDGACVADLTCECTHDGDCDQPETLCGGVVTCNTAVPGGKCEVVAGTPVVCEPTDVPCHVNLCDGATGACIVMAAPDGTACTDDDSCTGFDACVAGACDGGAPLECDDGAYCNGQETCDKFLGCVAGIAPSVGDGITCTVDACDEETDSITHFPNHAMCDNQLYCDGTEQCDVTEGCIDGDAPSIEDNDPCTVGSCNEELDQVLQTSSSCGFSLLGSVLSEGGGSSVSTQGTSLTSTIGAPHFAGTSTNGAFTLRAGLPRGGN